jgi:hypothetical protein
MSDFTSLEGMNYGGIEHQMHRCQRALDGMAEVHRWVDPITEKTIGITFATESQPFVFEYDLAYMRIKGRDRGIEPKYQGKLEPEQIIGELVLRNEYLTTSGWFIKRAIDIERAKQRARPVEEFVALPKFL